MRIIIAGTVDVDPEKRDAILREAKPFIEAGQAVKGCIAYDWTPDPFDSGRIHVFEEWTGEAELAAHFQGDAYKSMLGHMSQAGIKASSTQKYRVDHFEPVYNSEGVPRADFFTAP